MQIQKVNSNQNNPNFNGLLKVSEDLTLFPDEILTGVFKGEIFEYLTGNHEGHFMLYKDQLDGRKIAIQFKEINNELLAKIARAKSTITDTVEDISNYVKKILVVYKKGDE